MQTILLDTLVRLFVCGHVPRRRHESTLRATGDETNDKVADDQKWTGRQVPFCTNTNCENAVTVFLRKERNAAFSLDFVITKRGPRRCQVCPGRYDSLVALVLCIRQLVIRTNETPGDEVSFSSSSDGAEAAGGAGSFSPETRLPHDSDGGSRCHAQQRRRSLATDDGGERSQPKTGQRLQYWTAHTTSYETQRSKRERERQSGTQLDTQR